MPWKKILTSRTVWSINLAGFGRSLGIKAQRMISLYMDDVLKLNIAEVWKILSSGLENNRITSNYRQIWLADFPMILIVSSIVGDVYEQNNIVNTCLCR